MIRIVDLSHPLAPGKQRFRLDVESFPVNEYVPGYQVAEGEWYIMQELRICSHVGVHVEAPFHALADGVKAGRIDHRRLIGAAAVVDFTGKKKNEPISGEEMQVKGTHVQPGDIVLIRTGLSRHFGTPEYQRPYLEESAIDWLIQHDIKCLGIDCSGIENKTINSRQVNHRKLFRKNIPLIEDMNNLDKLEHRRVFFLALTLPIEDLDASPLRPIAIEPLEECEHLLNIFLGKETRWLAP